LIARDILLVVGFGVLSSSVPACAQSRPEPSMLASTTATNTEIRFDISQSLVRALTNHSPGAGSFEPLCLARCWQANSCHGGRCSSFIDKTHVTMERNLAIFLYSPLEPNMRKMTDLPTLPNLESLRNNSLSSRMSSFTLRGLHGA
jgi:hypothetical protein